MATNEFANDVLDHIIPDRASCLQSKTLVMTIDNSIGMVVFCFDNTYCMFLMVVHDYKSYNIAMTHKWPDILEFTKL